MKTRHHIPVALLGAFIAATSALHATAVENTLSVPMPDFQTPAQLAKWRAETTAKTVAKEAAQTASSRLSTVDSSTFSLNSGVPTPLAPPQGSGAARSSQSNQLPPVAGFYTGKPYLAESGSYAFKYREYNPEMTRWTTLDPSGFPDGANNRLYAAVPTSEIDNNGLNVVATYSITSMTLTIDGTQYTGCNSGDNKPADQSVANVGPIPIGSYDIFNRSGGIGGYAAFILDPNDSKTLNDQWDGKYNNRNNFRLHVGGAGSTIGCIVSNDIKKIASQILGTTLNNTTLYQIDTGSGSPRYFQSYLYGTLTVTE